MWLYEENLETFRFIKVWMKNPIALICMTGSRQLQFGFSFMPQWNEKK